MVNDTDLPNGQPASPPPEPAADSLVALVSQTVVNQRAFMNNCGIPLAAFVDFHPASQLQLPRVQGRQPARCKSCASFMNVFCKTNLAKSVWKCNFCGQANIYKDELPAAASDLSKFPELREEAVEYCYSLPPSPDISSPFGKAPQQAEAKPPGHIILLIDATLEKDAMDNLRVAVLEALSPMDPKTLLSVVSCDGVVSLHNLAPPSEAGGCCFAHALPGGDVVSEKMLAYFMGLPGTQLVAELGVCLPHLGALLECIRPLEQDKPVRQRSRCSFVAMGAALWLAAAHLGAIAQAVFIHIHIRIHATTPSQHNTNTIIRCLFVAVEAALRLAAAHLGAIAQAVPDKLPIPSRLLCMVSGPITKGPGMVPLSLLDDTDLHASLDSKPSMKAAHQHACELAAIANAVGMPIDVFVGSELSVNIPVLGQLAHESGGELVAHECFGQLFGVNLQTALTRKFGVRGMLDCYVSDGVRLVQWMGSVDVLQPWPTDEYSRLVQDRRLSANACSVSSLQLGHGAAIRLELTQDLKVPAIYLQVVLQFVEVGSRDMIQQVITRRIAVVSTIGEYLQGVQPAVASVVTGKKLVLDAKKLKAMRDLKKAEEIRYQASAELAQIAHRFGKEVQVSRGMLGFGARKAWALPVELLPLAAALYNFQRGPYERLLHMNTLLSAGGQAASLAMTGGQAASLAMSPQLYLIEVHASTNTQAAPSTPTQPELHVHPIPSVNMAAHMYSKAGKMLLLDAGSAFMLLTPPSSTQPQPGATPGTSNSVATTPFPAPSISLTKQTSLNLFPAPVAGLDPADAYLVVKECKALSLGRFPVPELRVMSADVEAYQTFFMQSLVPIHRDSPQDQAIQFPGLQNLAEADVRKITESLCMPTDEASFVAWCLKAEDGKLANQHTVRGPYPQGLPTGSGDPAPRAPKLSRD
eukprot:gene14314-20298_t